MFSIDSQLMSTYLVPLYFVHITFAFVILAWWFSSHKDKIMKKFGWGLAGYAVGIAIWTGVILAKPVDLELYILAGVIPFLLAHLAYAKAATIKSKSNLVMTLTLLLIVTTFVARTFFYPSNPYFSPQGYFFFGLQPIPLALYIATISVSLLPGVRAAVEQIKNRSMQQVMSVGLMIVYIGIIIQITAQDDTVRLINGVVASGALLVMWVECIRLRPNAK